jgi:hypothetical protein
MTLDRTTIARITFIRMIYSKNDREQTNYKQNDTHQYDDTWQNYSRQNDI